MQIRPATEDDLPYAYSTELKSLRESSFWGRVSPRLYTRLHSALLQRRYARPSVRVFVACDEEDPTFILGWVSVEDADTPIIHYVYVRTTERRKGIARRLLEYLGAQDHWVYSNWTHPGSLLLAGLKLGAGFSPYHM